MSALGRGSGVSARPGTMTRRLRPRLAYLLMGGALLGGVTLAFGTPNYPDGPPPSRTGAWTVGGKGAEGNCTGCHSGSSNLNNNGSIKILGIPTLYDPGQTYTLTVQLNSGQTLADLGRRWGFELTAVRADNGDSAGTFTLTSPDTLKIVTGAAQFAVRAYVEHQFIGIRDSLAGPVEWSFQWTAPNPAVDRIYFFAAGNAANGDDSFFGDWIYTTADSSDEDPVATRPVSWGTLKSRYR